METREELMARSFDVYVTKFALTKGVYPQKVVSVEPGANEDGTYWTDGNIYYCKNVDAFLTMKAAQANAIARAYRKIASHQRSIAKLTEYVEQLQAIVQA